MQENEDQNNSEYGHFLGSVFHITKTFMTLKINKLIMITIINF